MFFLATRSSALRVLAGVLLLISTVGHAQAAGFTDSLAGANGVVGTQGGLCTNAAGNGTACGFHDSMDFNGQRLAYAVIPTPGGYHGLRCHPDLAEQ